MRRRRTRRRGCGIGTGLPGSARADGSHPASDDRASRERPPFKASRPCIRGSEMPPRGAGSLSDQIVKQVEPRRRHVRVEPARVTRLERLGSREARGKTNHRTKNDHQLVSCIRQFPLLGLPSESFRRTSWPYGDESWIASDIPPAGSRNRSGAHRQKARRYSILDRIPTAASGEASPGPNHPLYEFRLNSA